jgi:hypothetical protein
MTLIVLLNHVESNLNLQPFASILKKIWLITKTPDIITKFHFLEFEPLNQIQNNTFL